MQNENQSELDRILDSALAAYSVREPLTGLDQRVIARLPQPKRTPQWLKWLLPVPVLAAILITVLAYLTAVDSPAPRPTRIVQRPVQPRTDPHPETARSTKPLGSRDTLRAAQPGTPRPTVFPAPLPMTAEEQALLQLARANPEMLQETRMAQERQTRPLSVDPIEIAPLANGNSMED